MREDVRRVLSAFDLNSAKATPITMGLINETFRIDAREGSYALQRLHPAFAGTLNDDLDAITTRVDGAGIPTPRLLRTTDGAAFVGDEGNAWRMITWLEGEAFHATDGPDKLASAGRLVARFHGALIGMEHEFAFSRPGAHDTAAHRGRLAERAKKPHPRADVLVPLASAITGYPLARLPKLPKRIVHGDLKFSNILFRGDEAVALVDLDTLQWGNVVVELGDALRSWCNPQGEDTNEPHFRRDYYDAAIGGYFDEVGPWLSDAERAAIPLGPERIALELSSRFCLDAFEESYFRWDEKRFGSSSEHNEMRARAQLFLAKSAEAQLSY
ncbi:MAG: Ser/Thr protein kinase RdoA (MazF antagonist) [Polyangiales bacterium]|jgi:Ser/Thr protein kinase RdoA (MazF antagonist)